MYVCSCNAIREYEVTRCVQQDGASTVAQVFCEMGAELCCKRCVPDMRKLIREAIRETEVLESACAMAR